MIDFTLSQGVSTMIPICFQFPVYACNSKLWLAPYFIDLHPSVPWQLDFCLPLIATAGEFPNPAVLVDAFLCSHVAVCVLRYITKVLKYDKRFLSALSRFPNMKGFYWAVRIDLSLSCNQLKNNFDLSCPKLSLTCPKLSLTCPKLSLSCPKLSLTWPKLSPAVPGYYLAVPKAVTDG